MFRLAWSILLGTSLILSSCGSAPVATSPEPVTTEDDNPEETVDQGTDTSIQETAPEDSTDPEATPEPEETHEPEVTPEPEWYYAQAVESYEAGPEAGFGQDRFPGIVLGPPSGIGPAAGSLDVLSLGIGGVITLSFGEMEIIDGDGPDLIVFENPFWVGGDPANVWAELAEVAVSMDGESWTTWSCQATPGEPDTYSGCAGWQPTLAYEASSLIPLDPSLTGGDAFDLAELGLERARYVRITDLAADGAAPTAGFDLDAVGIVHGAPITD